MENNTVGTDWWKGLEPQWQKALSISFFRHFNEPRPEELARLFASPSLRLAGPRAPFPNLPFELTSLSALAGLHNLEVLVVTHHQLTHIEELGSLKKLKSLFLFNNQIVSLKGIEELKALEQLYVQFNRIESLKPIKKLVNLKEVYVNDNAISSLDGLTEKHSDKLGRFVCRPNPLLHQKEMIRAENMLGIKCF